jgi:hypothetical protein
MDGKLWRRLYRIARRVADDRRGFRQQYADWEILMWQYWAALNDRPLAWLIRTKKLPPQLAGRRRPSAATLSRRLRSERLMALAALLEHRLTRPTKAAWCKYLDGKLLAVGRGSKDQGAGLGRGVKGYRLHAIVDGNHGIYAWTILSNNVAEVPAAKSLISQLTSGGYLVADGEYDSSDLHDLAHQQGCQLVARRSRPGTGLGHCRQSPHRRRSMELLERDGWIDNGFGDALLTARKQIERFFGNLTSFAGGLAPLPAWVRTPPRVRRWVQAKLIFNAVRIQLKATA